MFILVSGEIITGWLLDKPWPGFQISSMAAATESRGSWYMLRLNCEGQN